MKTENQEKTVILTKDSLAICGKTLIPPFTIEQVTSLLGSPRLVEKQERHKNIYTGKEESYTVRIYVWDELGLQGWVNEQQTEIKGFLLCFAPLHRNLSEGIFDGIFKIGKKDYREVKWKADKFDFAHYVELGNFTVYTLLPSPIPENEESKEVMEYFMCHAEITWEQPKIKTTKYKLKQPEEPVLVFKNFNFKLAVIEVLMYEKGLLKPKFDVYEFAKEYSHRKINVNTEGYEPIREAVKWFKDLPIPVRLASEVTEIDMDGGDEIYLQIYPFWDGEDNMFSLDKVASEEIKQFPGLKKVTLMTGNYKKVAKVFNEVGIETASI